MTDSTAIPYAQVDPKSPVPLYHQVYLDLRSIIQNGLIPAGGMFPTEMELCEIYAVGRQTIRHAIARLVDDNLLERFAGRGTFVQAQPAHTQFFLDRSFSQQMRELGREPRSITLSSNQDMINLDVNAALRSLNEKSGFVLERLRLGGEEPICHQTTTVVLEQCPGIENVDFTNQSLYEVLTKRFNLVITRIDHLVRAVAADEYRAELLKIAVGDPVLLVITTAYIEGDEIIEYSVSYYRADKYEYSTIETG